MNDQQGNNHYCRKVVTLREVNKLYWDTLKLFDESFTGHLLLDDTTKHKVDRKGALEMAKKGVFKSKLREGFGAYFGIQIHSQI